MARYYASLVDVFVYFPVGNIPLRGDNMKSADKEYQTLVDEQILVAFKALKVSESRIHRLQSVSVDGRVKEVLGLFT
ncbi:hypothetical protein HYW21_05465 [Candidatus Woesearchaeota archaeon]|nr:hypothetical protein [Candidatus Woesearchaeota archaeon]